MRVLEPSVTPSRSEPVAAPSRSGVDRGPAFDDMLLAASEPSERRTAEQRGGPSARSEGFDADRTVRLRSESRSGNPASSAKRAGVAAHESDVDVDVDGQARADSAEAAITGSLSTGEAATADREPTAAGGPVGAVTSPEMIGQSAPPPGSAPMGSAGGTRIAASEGSAEQASAPATVETPTLAVPAASSTHHAAELPAAPGALVDPPAAGTVDPRSGADVSVASSNASSDIGAGTAASATVLPAIATTPTAAVTASARLGVTTGAASIGEGPRPVGELTVRVADAPPSPPREAPSASGEAAPPPAPSSSPSAPGVQAAPAPLTGGSLPVQQADAAAPALPGRPTHGTHPPLSTQIGTELLSLRQAADGDHLVTVAVRPDNLGPVTISAVVGRDGMSVELFSPSSEGRDALKQMLPDLRRDLASAGGSGSSLDLGARDTPQERPRHREFSGGGRVPEPRFRAPAPAVLHPSSARLDVLV